MNTNFDIYQAVTDRIIATMEKGIIPWRKPWTGTADGAVRYASGKPYSLLNQFLLERPGEWLTWNEIKAQGGTVKKGAKAGMVVFFKQLPIKDRKEDEDEEKVRRIPFLRYYNVFHIDDCEGVKSRIESRKRTWTNTPIERAEEVVAAYATAEPHLQIVTNEASNRAYYSPSRDRVVVPTIAQYEAVEEYYSTLFHELTHSTGIKSRCDRGLEEHAAFGSAVYSREELVAEMGSAMVCNAIGISTEKAFRNSVAYLQSWIDALKSDKRMIVWAAGRAEKAVRYMFGEVTEKEVEQ